MASNNSNVQIKNMGSGLNAMTAKPVTVKHAAKDKNKNKKYSLKANPSKKFAKGKIEKRTVVAEPIDSPKAPMSKIEKPSTEKNKIGFGPQGKIALGAKKGKNDKKDNKDNKDNKSGSGKSIVKNNTAPSETRVDHMSTSIEKLVRAGGSIKSHLPQGGSDMQSLILKTGKAKTAKVGSAASFTCVLERTHDGRTLVKIFVPEAPVSWLGQPCASRGDLAYAGEKGGVKFDGILETTEDAISGVVHGIASSSKSGLPVAEVKFTLVIVSDEITKSPSPGVPSHYSGVFIQAGSLAGGGAVITGKAVLTETSQTIAAGVPKRLQFKGRFSSQLIYPFVTIIGPLTAESRVAVNRGLSPKADRAHKVSKVHSSGKNGALAGAKSGRFAWRGNAGVARMAKTAVRK
jgi:hypothetical protein